jgi:integrase
VDSCLRAGDVLKLRVAEGLAKHFYVREEKTNKVTKCCLLLEARRAVRDYLSQRGATNGACYLFPGRFGKPLSTRAYQKLVQDWVSLLRCNRVQLPTGYISTHSFRRSKPTYLYEQEHDIIACQRLLNHSKLDTTLRYLMVDAEAGIELASRHPF